MHSNTPLTQLPSSPPDTPSTVTTFKLANRKTRRRGMHLDSSNSGIIPNGSGPSFSYKPSVRPQELSPLSSSNNTAASESSNDGSVEPRSRSQSIAFEPAEQSTPSSPRPYKKGQGTFILEEINESDMDTDNEDIIRPHQYEDAESDSAQSTRNELSTNIAQPLDPRVIDDFGNLDCNASDNERQAWIEEQRAKKRDRRRSSATVRKRTFTESIGSGADDEDVQPGHVPPSDAGSGTRRLRRKVADRESLIFDDPPPRIVEEYEPESCEEVEEGDGEDYAVWEAERVDRELPYFVQIMDVDSTE